MTPKQHSIPYRLRETDFDRVEVLGRLNVVERGERTAYERELEGHVRSLFEQLESLRRVAENVRVGWLVEHVDDAQLDKALHDLDAWLQASSPAPEPDATEGLPSDLARILRDPTITITRDHEIRLADGRTLFEHLHEWQNAPSNTASASSPASEPS